MLSDNEKLQQSSPDRELVMNDTKYYGTFVPKSAKGLKDYTTLTALLPYMGQRAISELPEHMAMLSSNNLWSSHKNILNVMRAVMDQTVTTINTQPTQNPLESMSFANPNANPPQPNIEGMLFSGPSVSEVKPKKEQLPPVGLQ
jgi:hypothetical protein